MFNPKFTFLKIFDVTQDFDVAECSSNAVQSQYKHNILFSWIQHTAVSQYKCDSHYQFLYAHHQNTRCPLLPKRSTWVEGNSSPFLSSKIILLVFQFLYFILGRSTCILAPCWSGNSGRHVSSFDLLRENHYITSCSTGQLVCSTDTVVCLKQRPPSSPLCVEISSDLFATVSHSLHSFLSYISTLSLPISELSSLIGICWPCQCKTAILWAKFIYVSAHYILHLILCAFRIHQMSETHKTVFCWILKYLSKVIYMYLTILIQVEKIVFFLVRSRNLSKILFDSQQHSYVIQLHEERVIPNWHSCQTPLLKALLSFCVIILLV